MWAVQESAGWPRLADTPTNRSQMREPQGNPSPRGVTRDAGGPVGTVLDIGSLLSSTAAERRRLGRRAGRGQTLFRQGGGLPRHAALPRGLAGESAEHPAHSFVVGGIGLSGLRVTVADGGPVHAERCGRQPFAGPLRPGTPPPFSGAAGMVPRPSRPAHPWRRGQAAW